MRKLIGITILLLIVASSLGAVSCEKDGLALTVKTNEPVSFELKPQQCLQFGYSSGFAAFSFRSNEPISSIDPYKELSLFNESNRTVRLDGIVLNQAGMLFNYDAFCYKFGIKDKIDLDIVQDIFWHNYALTHHAQPQIYDSSANVTRMWNVFGYGLCYWQNKVFDDFMYQSGTPFHHIPVFGHYFKEYYIDGKWRAMEFNMKSYYLTPDGDVASHQDAFYDPYLVSSKVTGALSEDVLDEIAALQTMMLQFQPNAIKTQSVPAGQEADFAVGKTTLTIQSGEKVTFTNQPISNVITDHTEGSWKNCNFFIRKGTIDLKPIEYIAGSNYTIKRNLPFVIDTINIDCDMELTGKNSNCVIELVSGGKAETLGKIDSISGTKIHISKKLSKPTDSFDIVFKTNTSPDEMLELKNIDVSLGFFYNARIFWDLQPTNKLTLLGREDSKLIFNYVPNEEYKNDYFDEKEAVVEFKEKEYSIEVAISPKKKVSHFEYYISLADRDYPVSPSHYFVDKEGVREIPKETLPTGEYKLHYRCFYKSDDVMSGYWSKWKVVDKTVRFNNISKDVPMDFYLEKEKLFARIDKNCKEKNLTIIICDEKNFPVRKDQFFITEWDGEGKSYLRYSLTSKPHDRYIKISLKPGQVIEWPKWGSFYRFTQKGQIIGTLFDTRVILKDEGFKEIDKYVKVGYTVINDWNHIKGMDIHDYRRVKASHEDMIYAPIVKEGDYSYRVELPRYFTFLTATGSKVFSAKLYEDGKLLPYPNSNKEDVMAKGMGRFTVNNVAAKVHRYATYPYLYFSTSDNTDPRTNSRTYKLVSSEIEYEITLILK